MASATNLADQDLTEENAAIARVVRLKLAGSDNRRAAPKVKAKGPDYLQSATDALAFVERSIETRPRETFAVALVVAFTCGTLWRRGVL